MNASTWALLSCIGVVALILNEAIQRIKRNLNEIINNQRTVFPKVQQLEGDVSTLKMEIKGMQREMDKLKLRSVTAIADSGSE